ncbi:melanoma-associated antigen B16-like [Loxodonta africana]|uniref:melanoma-associated antigen B16-like n=1 Tax=Loxodonta africana TaxID=9785 RepID=UPI0005405739|nr:melanoma-associated antigen B16-like [Loxodonta africana]
MPSRKESPRIPPEEHLHICSEAEGLDDELLLEVEEETSSSSSSSPTPSNLEEDTTAEIPSSAQDSQSEYASSTALSASSEGTSDEDSSSEEDEETSRTSESPLDIENLPRNPVEEKVAMLVNFLLFKYQIKEPVTKADMLDTVIKEYEDHFTEILLKASERIEMVFGLDVKEVDPVSHCYVLLIKLDLTYDGMLIETEGMPKSGLLILILGVIFMKGNRITEEEIWEVLNTMDIYAGRKHFIFGEPGNLVTKELVQEKYLEYRQLPDSDPPRYEFLWGPRAHAEISKMKLLEFLARVHGVDPPSFSQQYREALKEEEEKAQAGASASSGATATAMESSSGTSSSCSHP